MLKVSGSEYALYLVESSYFSADTYNVNLQSTGKRTMVDALIASNRLEVLLANDQLKRVMMQNAAFQGFHEGRIEFMPTFKFDNSRMARNSPSSKGTSPVKSTISESSPAGVSPSSVVESSSPDSSPSPEIAQADSMLKINPDPVLEGGLVQDGTLVFDTLSLLDPGGANDSSPPPLTVVTSKEDNPIPAFICVP